MKSLFYLRFNCLFLVLGASVCRISAQDFMASPLGDVPGNLTLSPGQSDFADLIEGLSYSVRLNSTYVNNLDLREQQSGRDGDFFLSAGANISYQLSPGGLWEGSIGYAPNYRLFFSDQDRPGAFAQSANASLSYRGSSITGNFRANFNAGGQSNNLAGGFVQSSRLGLNGSLSWNFSPKTSLNFNLGYNTDVFSDSDFGGTEAVRYGLSVLWRATPLIRIGPSLNLGYVTSDNAGSSESFGLGVNINYELSGKTSLSANLGFQDQTFGNGGGSSNFAGGVNLNWRPDDLYRVTLGFRTSNVAAPAANNQFVNNYNFNLNVSRSLGVGNLSLRTGFSWSEFLETDLATETFDAQQALNLGVNYSRPILYQQVSLNVSAGYRKGLSGREFASSNLSLGLGYSF